MPPRRRMQTADKDEQPDNFVIDFGNVEELSDDPLPVSSYFVEVQSAKLDRAQDGKRFMQLTTVVIEPEEFAGRKLKDRIYLTQDSLWRAKKAFRAFGFDVDGPLDMVSIAADIVGKEVDVITKIDTLPLDGRKISRINRYIPAGGEEEEDEDDSEF